MYLFCIIWFCTKEFFAGSRFYGDHFIEQGLIVEVSFSSINEVYRLGVGFLTKWGRELTTGECSVENVLMKKGDITACQSRFAAACAFLIVFLFCWTVFVPPLRNDEKQTRLLWIKRKKLWEKAQEAKFSLDKTIWIILKSQSRYTSRDYLVV